MPKRAWESVLCTQQSVSHQLRGQASLALSGATGPDQAEPHMTRALRSQPAPHKGVPVVGRWVDGLRQILAVSPQPAAGAAPAMRLRVQCARCGEVITTRIDKANDLLCEYPDKAADDEIPHPTGYTLYKELVGRHCQNLVHLTMHFNDHRRATRHEIEGGALLGWEECQ
jgi:hypothetical protein